MPTRPKPEAKPAAEKKPPKAPKGALPKPPKGKQFKSGPAKNPFTAGKDTPWRNR
jgi:hypothetical protein